MSAASDYLETQLGTHLLRTSSWVKPTEIWVVLFTTLPNDDGTGFVEVSTSGTGYARIQNGPGDAFWTAPTAGNGEFSNVSVIQYATPTGTWGSVVGFGLFDQLNNLLIHSAFAQALVVGLGDPAPGFKAGGLKVRFA